MKNKKNIAAVIITIILILSVIAGYWYWKKYYSWIPKDARVNDAAQADVSNYYGEIVSIGDNEITLKITESNQSRNIKIIVDNNARFFENKEVESEKPLVLSNGQTTNKYFTYVENKDLSVQSLKVGMSISVGFEKDGDNLLAREINIDK